MELNIFLNCHKIISVAPFVNIHEIIINKFNWIMRDLGVNDAFI